MGTGVCLEKGAVSAPAATLPSSPSPPQHHEELGRYRRFVVQLSTQPYVLHALHRDVPCPDTDLEVWAKSIASAALHFGTYLPMTEMLMSFEVGKRPSNMLTGGSTEKTKTFLRQTSLLAKVLDVFTKARLLDFVREVVSPVLRRVVEVSKDVVLETDESRAPDAEKLDDARKELGGAIGLFVENLERNVEKAPPMLRQLCRQIYDLAMHCSGDAPHMISSYVMLRCLTAAIVCPENYGLGGELDGASLDCRRSLVAVSKVVQKMASNVRFEAQDRTQEALNAVLDTLTPRFRQTILALANPPHPTPGHRGPDPALSLPVSPLKACHTLHRELIASLSGLQRCMAHYCPLVDHFTVLQQLLDTLPPPSPEGVLSRFPEPKSDDYALLLHTARFPTGSWEGKLTAVARTRFLRVCGMNAERHTVAQIYAQRVPADPALQEAMLLLFVRTMDTIVTSSYHLVVLVQPELGMSTIRPTFTWLNRIYEYVLPRKYKKNIKGLYLLNPPFWVRTLINLFSPVVSTKVWGKVHYSYALDSLLAELQLHPSRFPAPIDLHPPPPMSVHLLYGCPLSEVMRREDQAAHDYPSMAYQCIHWIDMHGVAAENLFARCALPRNWREILSAASCPDYVIDLAAIGLHGTAALLLEFLRSIPDGLFAPVVTELMAAAVDLNSTEPAKKSLAVERISKELTNMSLVHLALSRDLFSLLHKIFSRQTDLSFRPQPLDPERCLDDLVLSLVGILFPSRGPAAPQDAARALLRHLILQGDSCWCELTKSSLPHRESQ